MTKAIVFGGSGFLGSHVCDALTKAGYEVRIFDIKPSRYLKIGQQMVVADILDEDAVRKAIKGCDYVYNFAGTAQIEDSKKDPVKAVKTNILGTVNILEGCGAFKVKRFIFASTLYVYSNSGSFYRSTKQACELLIENYHEIYGLDFTILRYGSLYGPRANQDNWINRILRQVLTESKITRHGDGEEIREYIHVLDAARLSVDVLEKDFNNDYVIIAGNQSIKIKDLFVMIREMLNGKVKLEFLATDSKEHYEITPYNFSPKLAKRIHSSSYVDLGQGILDLMDQIYKEIRQ